MRTVTFCLPENIISLSGKDNLRDAPKCKKVFSSSYIYVNLSWFSDRSLKTNSDQMRGGLTIFFLLFLLGFDGCVPKPVNSVAVTKQNSRYVTEFSFPDASVRLESITHSLSKLITVAYYTTYQFDANDHIRQFSLYTGSFKKSASSITASHETVSGTATLIFRSENRVAFLTCAHILDFPDTVIVFSDPSKTLSTDQVKSIAIKDKQEIYCRDVPGCGPLDLLAMDRGNDIALIGRECPNQPEGMKPIEYHAGRAKELGWGCAAYVIGFPMGALMITRGIVSNPNSDESGTFMIDALFNKGFSGGIIMAARKGSQGFELVGMVRSAYSKKEYVLRPEKEIHEYSYYKTTPYTGETYVGTDEAINYGITYAIPVEALRAFYKAGRPELIRQGYDLDHFFLTGE